MILADTGCFYALLDRDDAWHLRCREAAAALDEGLITTWPVLTEAVHLITRWIGVEPATALMDEVADGDIIVWDVPPASRAKVPGLMRRYADLPMDLADKQFCLELDDPLRRLDVLSPLIQIVGADEGVAEEGTEDVESDESDESDDTAQSKDH